VQKRIAITELIGETELSSPTRGDLARVCLELKEEELEKIQEMMPNIPVSEFLWDSGFQLRFRK
jgi:hypothetical protein